MLVVCAQCGTKNRVDEARLAEAKCGSCGAPLAPSAPTDIDGPHLEKYLQGPHLPTVVDFWAEWCGPCKMMAPQFQEAARRRPNVRFLKLDTDAAPEISARYGIRGIPTMILFVAGREKARQSGAMGAAQIVAWIDAQLAA